MNTLRLKCSEEFFELGDRLGEFLRTEIQSEWAEWKCLISATMSDAETIEELANITGSQLNSLQWKITLTYLSFVDDPTSVRLNLVDIAALLLMGRARWSHVRSDFDDFAVGLLQLQRYRTACLEMNASFSELSARSALDLIGKCRERAAVFSPFFANDMFANQDRQIA